MLLKKQRYLVVGGTTMDIICKANNLEKINLSHYKTMERFVCLRFASKTPLKDFVLDFGGSAANSACTLSKVGAAAYLVSCVGADYFGRACISNLKEFGVKSDFVKKRGKKTGFGISILSSDGEKSVLVYRGANDNLSSSDVSEGQVKKVDYVFITSLVSRENFLLFKKIVNICKKNNKPVIFAPSISMLREYKKELSRLEDYFDITIMNLEEARYYTSKFDIKDVIKKLPGVLRVVTADVLGAYAYDGDRILKTGIIPLRVIDATGAGDSFSATFCFEFFKSKSVESALIFATLCASLKINHTGARFNKSIKEINSALRKYKKYLKVKEIR